MSQFAREHREALISGEPIEVFGLNVFPIKVRHYEDYQACKSVLLLRQSTLPASYVAMPFLAAIHALEIDSVTSGGQGIGLWAKLKALLCLTLNIPSNMASAAIRIFIDPNDPRALKSIQIMQGEVKANITPAQFSKIRRVIAEMNGDELPDEADNPELIEAAEDMAERNALDLNNDFEDLLASVALAYRLRRSELLDWTVREFSACIRAIDRDKRFMICALAETAAGAKFTKGNPVPSWMFDKNRNGCAALVTMEQLNASIGNAATMA